MGFSLELPSFHLNDTEPLKPPVIEKTPLKGKEKGLPAEPTPFLWQAPNANAALYFGDKWIEFHSFLSARLTKPPSNRRRVFSQKHPAWLESLLELFRARGYSMLYPSFPNKDDALVTIHDELYQVPEEYSEAAKKSPSYPTPELNPDEPLLANSEKKSYSPPPNDEHQLLESDLVSLLPNDGDLPNVPDLPLMSYNGITMSRKLSHEAAMAFSELYRSEIGTCRTDAETTQRAVNSALDLFCHLDEIYDPYIPQTPPRSPTPKPTPEPPDEDAIPTHDHVNAKQELSAHLARQEDRVGPVHAGAPMSQANQPPQDDAEGPQSEFKSQMQRQAKQAAAAQAAPASADSVVKDVPKAGEAPGQNHDSFTKQPPPIAAKEPNAADMKEKGAGW